MKEQKVIIFAPQIWGEVTKFNKFYHSTYSFKPFYQMASKGVESHFDKFITLYNLAIKLRPMLVEDDMELKEKGFSNAIRSKELSSVIESAFIELYSSLNCMMKVLKGIYSNHNGIPSVSTRKLFKNAHDNKIDSNVPLVITDSLKNAKWFPGLCKIRDELVHSEIGFCSNSKDKISYLHPNLEFNGNALVFEDVFSELDKYKNHVNSLLGTIYSTLNESLNDKSVEQLCGIANGRILMRKVSFKEAKDFNSGECLSYIWFEKDENPTCPFAETCEAYKRIKSGN
jgi:uncharacterized protein YaaR (DUF327 family)